jgi:uncharacterized protein (TIGR00369 family)
MLKYALPLVFVVRPSIVYEMLRRRIAEIIPLNKLLGIEIISIGDGVAETRLPFRSEVTNHIGSMHASAIFGVAEAASGCAMSGAFAPVALSIRPVAASAQVHFSKIARSALIAHAKTSETSEGLRAKLKEAGKVVFDVVVDVRDEGGTDVAKVTVAWHVATK